MDNILFSCDDKVEIEFGLQDFDKYNYGDDPDVSILMLDENNKISNEKDILFYGNESSEDGSISFFEQEWNKLTQITFSKISKRIQKLLFVATIYLPNANLHKNIMDIRISSENNDKENFCFSQTFEMLPSQNYKLFSITRGDSNWNLKFIEEYEDGMLIDILNKYCIESLLN